MPDQNIPQVLPDNRVTFRIYAPKADEVSIEGEWIPQGRGTGGPLQKDDQGVWSITVGPLVPDFYTYTLTVDGVPTIDPQNPTIKQGIASSRTCSWCRARRWRSRRPDRFRTATCGLCGMTRQHWAARGSMRVYTPPEYDGSDETYPVLYLIHGGGDDDSGVEHHRTRRLYHGQLAGSGKGQAHDRRHAQRQHSPAGIQPTADRRRPELAGRDHSANRDHFQRCTTYSSRTCSRPSFRP